MGPPLHLLPKISVTLLGSCACLYLLGSFSRAASQPQHYWSGLENSSLLRAVLCIIRCLTPSLASVW